MQRIFKIHLTRWYTCNIEHIWRPLAIAKLLTETRTHTAHIRISVLYINSNIVPAKTKTFFSMLAKQLTVRIIFMCTVSCKYSDKLKTSDHFFRLFGFCLNYVGMPYVCVQCYHNQSYAYKVEYRPTRNKIYIGL